MSNYIKTKYKNVYGQRFPDGKILYYAVFTINGKKYRSVRNKDMHKIALFVDTKRIEFGLSPINVLKAL